MAGEGKLQTYMKRRCAEEGIFWRKIKFEGVNGAPDTVIAYGGRVMFCELKNPNGSGVVSEQQKRRIAELTNVGVTARILSSRGVVDAVIDEIKS